MAFSSSFKKQNGYRERVRKIKYLSWEAFSNYGNFFAYYLFKVQKIRTLEFIEEKKTYKRR